MDAILQVVTNAKLNLPQRILLVIFNNSKVSGRGNAFGFSVRFMCPRQIPSVGYAGFYYRSFYSTNCNERFAPMFFIQDNYCYSQQQVNTVPMSQKMKDLNLQSVRMFWNSVENVAQFQFYKSFDCIGSPFKNVKIKEGTCSALDDYHVMVAKKI
jgi:polyphosphate kinase 2 (PPK2 family)